MKAAIYARVSTTEQNVQTQIVPLTEYAERNGLDIFDVYADIGESGSKDSRPEFDRMLADMRHGRFKAVLIYKMDRIGRSLQHLLKLFEEFKRRGIDIIILTQNIDTTTPEGRFFMKLMMLIAEYERELIQNRIEAGIVRARKQGKILGRPRIQINRYEILRLRQQGLSVREIARRTEQSTSTIHRCIKNHPPE